MAMCVRIFEAKYLGNRDIASCFLLGAYAQEQSNGHVKMCIARTRSDKKFSFGNDSRRMT